MQKTNYIIIFLLLAIMPGYSFAQKLTASVNKTSVGLGKPIQVQFSIDGNGSGFQGPAFTDFEIASGPNPFQQMQIINGNMSQSISYSYTIIPKKEGKLTIGPASINMAGKKMESNPIVIVVSKGTPAGKNNGGSGQAAQNSKLGGDNLFVRSFLNKSKVYLGEAVTLTYKVYTRINLVGFQNAKIPPYTGFWAQEIPNPANYVVTKENLNGVNYSVIEFKKTFLFPQRTGTLEIDPVDIDCVVRQQSHNQDPWSMFINTEDIPVKIKGQVSRLEVIPLPETGKPQNFSGAVGQFTLKAQMNKEAVKANEAVNLNVSVSGKGNISLVEPPHLKIPPDIDSYDPKFSENLSVKTSGVEGTKSGEYVLIPRQRGSYKLEPLEFSFFDPEKKAYITLHSAEFNLSVEKGSDEHATISSPNTLNRKDIASVGTDIHYIKTQGFTLFQKNSFVFGSFLYVVGLIIPFVCFLLVVLLRRKYLNDNSDARLVKQRKATRMAQKRLKEARNYMTGGNSEKFYEEVSRSLYGYLSDKLLIQQSELSKDFVSVILNQKGVSPEKSTMLLELLDMCEYARYAPTSVSGNLNEIYQTCLALITGLEDEIRQGKKS
jgi:hypothetical protein